VRSNYSVPVGLVYLVVVLLAMLLPSCLWPVSPTHQGVTMRYAGWANYETWAVALRLNNDEGSYRYWREQAESWFGRESTSEYWSQSESARFGLADQLRTEAGSGNPLSDAASMWSDLMSAALGRIHWEEIADSCLGEIPEYVEVTKTEDPPGHQ